ncbi:hypothetical protein [Flavobacterium quisquiliarum]|uniref:YD repeat-containing protein n=1 Tax=Flavobacterium quisquiliarum TaxID=1834436 RepID=A0ABV8WDL9_9FLAO|nr:hypothetical protein [Flavobacterium quisquiliarum]MBW1653811.1 hypothetical protein [Flavobacterium quisquiliarum]NWK99241.1 hypothetical protein [Flavobacterium collinsii]
MKVKNILIYILIISAVLSCSSDNSNDSDGQDFNKNLLKSVTVEKGGYEELYKFENGFLTEITYRSADGENQNYKYEYDAEGKVIKQKYKSTTYSQSNSYEYDSQKRLIKTTVEGSDDYMTLEYTKNKVIVTHHRVLFLDKPHTYVTELNTDDTGRILKTIAVKGFTDENGEENYSTTEFVYDTRGNIIKRISSNRTSYIDIEENEYDDKNNPYYYSFKKLNQSLYYVIYNTLSSPALYYSPNNRTAIKYDGKIYVKDKMLYNSENFPVKKTHYIYEDGVNLNSEDEIILNYY